MYDRRQIMFSYIDRYILIIEEQVNVSRIDIRYRRDQLSGAEPVDHHQA